MADALYATHGHEFQPLQGADFYPAAGAVDDWAYGAEGLMAFTIELRGNDFVIAPSNILPSCEESLAATLELAEWTAEQSDVVVPPEGGSTSDGGDASSDDGSPQGSDEGDPIGSSGDDDSGATPGEDDDDDTPPGAIDPWLPAGYGMSPAEGSCACTSSGNTPRFLLLLPLLAALRRRRDHGTK